MVQNDRSLLMRPVDGSGWGFDVLMRWIVAVAHVLGSLWCDAAVKKIA
jgi:hypothetical protein